MDEASLATVTSWFTPTILFCVLNLMVATIYVTSSFKKNPNQVDEDHDPVRLFRAPSFLERVKSSNFSRFREAEAETRYVQHDEDMNNQEDVKRNPAPSLLERVKSINFSRHRAEQPETRYVQRDKDINDQMDVDEKRNSAPSLLERVKSINFSRYRAEQQETRYVQRDEEQVSNRETEENVGKSKSLPRVEGPARRKRKMKKSASAKIATTGVFLKDEEEKEEEVEFRRPETVRERKGKWDAADEDEAVDEKADNFISRFRQQLKLQRLESIILRTNGVGR